MLSSCVFSDRISNTQVKASYSIDLVIIICTSEYLSFFSSGCPVRSEIPYDCTLVQTLLPSPTDYRLRKHPSNHRQRSMGMCSLMCVFGNSHCEVATETQPALYRVSQRRVVCLSLPRFLFDEGSGLCIALSVFFSNCLRRSSNIASSLSVVIQCCQEATEQTMKSFLHSTQQKIVKCLLFIGDDKNAWAWNEIHSCGQR